MKTAEFTFEAPEEAGLPFKKLVLRETAGPDEVKAKSLSSAKGSQGSLYEELIKLSIVSLDDVVVDQPFEGFTNMSTRARSFIGAAFTKVNGSPDDLVSSFLSTSKMTV